MANHTWLYFINAEEMSNHWVSVRTQHIVWKREDCPELFAGVTDDVIATYRRSVRKLSKPSAKALSLLAWIARDLEECEKETAYEAAYLQDIIGGFLFKHKPGMYLAGDFRHEWAFDEDLIELCQSLPYVQQRLGIRDGRMPEPKDIENQRRAFLAGLTSPLRVLD